MTGEEGSLLLFLVERRSFDTSKLLAHQLKTIKELEKKNLVHIDELGIVRASSEAVTNVKIFKSNLNFQTMISRLSFSKITKLIHVILEDCFKRGIHLNVAFKNLSPDHLDLIQKELDEALSFKLSKALEKSDLKN